MVGIAFVTARRARSLCNRLPSVTLPKRDSFSTGRKRKVANFFQPCGREVASAPDRRKDDKQKGRHSRERRPDRCERSMMLRER
jgi:hypothetical protein